MLCCFSESSEGRSFHGYRAVTEGLSGMFTVAVLLLKIFNWFKGAFTLAVCVKEELEGLVSYCLKFSFPSAA